MAQLERCDNCGVAHGPSRNGVVQCNPTIPHGYVTPSDDSPHECVVCGQGVAGLLHDPDLRRDSKRLVIEPERVTAEGAIETGFRLEWISGDSDEGVSFNLTSGAGCGSPWMNLTVEFDDDRETIYERVDMRQVLQTWLGQILEEAT